MNKFMRNIVMSIIVIGTIGGAFALALSGTLWGVVFGILLPIFTSYGIAVYYNCTSLENKDSMSRNNEIDNRSILLYYDVKNMIERNKNNNVENISLKHADEIESYDIDRTPKLSVELEDIRRWDQVILGLNYDSGQKEYTHKAKVRKRTRDNFD